MTAQKKNSPFAAILNFIGTAIIIIIIAFCLTLVAPKIFGISETLPNKSALYFLEQKTHLCVL